MDYQLDNVKRMDSLSSFMDGQQSQMFKIARAARAVSQAQDAFNDLYPGVSAHVRVISFQDGVLKVAAGASSVIADIRLRENDVIRSINEQIQPLCVTRIVCLANG